MHNRQGLTPHMLWSAMTDWRMWPLYILGLVHLSESNIPFTDWKQAHHFLVPVSPPQTYLTLSLRNLGFNTTQSNLLTLPSNVLGLLLLLFAAYLSEMINSRVLATVLLQVWALPLLIALYTFDETTSQWVYFAVVTLITGYPYVHPLSPNSIYRASERLTDMSLLSRVQVAWASRNSNGVRTRTVSASVYNMFVQAGGIISVREISFILDCENHNPNL